jgi:hypothetical protein
MQICATQNRRHAEALQQPKHLAWMTPDEDSDLHQCGLWPLKKRFGPREIKVQFAVNGNEYFLSFVPEEGGWFVFTPTAQGFYRTPVVHDDELPIGNPVVVIPEDKGPKTIN